MGSDFQRRLRPRMLSVLKQAGLRRLHDVAWFIRDQYVVVKTLGFLTTLESLLAESSHVAEDDPRRLIKASATVTRLQTTVASRGM